MTTEPADILRTLSPFDRWLLVSLWRTEGHSVTISSDEHALGKSQAFFQLVATGSVMVSYLPLTITLAALGQQVAETAEHEETLKGDVIP